MTELLAPMPVIARPTKVPRPACQTKPISAAGVVVTLRRAHVVRSHVTVCSSKLWLTIVSRKESLTGSWAAQPPASDPIDG